MNADGTPHDPDGTGPRTSDDFLINSASGTVSADSPSVAALADGRFVVTWRGYDGGAFIAGRIFNADGTPHDPDGAGPMTSGDFIITTHSTIASMAPVVIDLKDGRFAVTWESNGDVYCRIYNSNGTPQDWDGDGPGGDGAFIINADTAGSQYAPTVSALSSGKFVVSWVSSLGDGADGGIRARVFGANAAPEVDQGIADQNATEDSAFRFPVPEDAFKDMDGESLSYAAILADGNPLPDWLDFDPQTGTFSGTPENGDVGTLSVKVTATDGSNASASTTFEIVVANTNDAPVLTARNQSLTPITEDQNSTHTVSALLGASVADVDAGHLKGMAITAVTGAGTWEYSTDGGTTWLDIGTVSNGSALLLRASDLVRFVGDGQNGTTASLTYRAWDQTSGAAGGRVDLNAAGATGGTTAYSSATDTATLSVTPVNDAPDLTPNDPTGVSYTENSGPVRLLSTAAVFDPDDPPNFSGGSITATLSGAVAGDRFSIANWPGNVQIAWDAGVLNVTVEGIVVGTVSGLGTASMAFRLNENATDSVVETLLQSITFLSLSENPTASPRSATITFNDGTGGSMADSVSVPITVIPVNDQPTTASTSESKAGSEDQAISGTLLPGSDLDGDSLTFYLVAGSETNGSVLINRNTGAYTFTPSPDYHGEASFAYVVHDGTVNSVPKTVTITVNPVSDAPTAQDESVTLAEEATHTFSAADFSAHFADGKDAAGSAGADLFTGIIITSVPATGTLRHDGTVYTAANLPQGAWRSRPRRSAG